MVNEITSSPILFMSSAQVERMRSPTISGCLTISSTVSWPMMPRRWTSITRRHLLLDRSEPSGAEGLRDLLAKFALLAGERLHRLLEEARHHHLHAVAVETDQLPQEGDRQQALAFLVLLLEDDRSEER